MIIRPIPESQIQKAKAAELILCTDCAADRGEHRAIIHQASRTRTRWCHMTRSAPDYPSCPRPMSDARHRSVNPAPVTRTIGCEGTTGGRLATRMTTPMTSSRTGLGAMCWSFDSTGRRVLWVIAPSSFGEQRVGIGSCLRDERREGVGAAWRCEWMGRGQRIARPSTRRSGCVIGMVGTVTSGMATCGGVSGWSVN